MNYYNELLKLLLKIDEGFIDYNNVDAPFGFNTLFEHWFALDDMLIAYGHGGPRLTELEMQVYQHLHNILQI